MQLLTEDIRKRLLRNGDLMQSFAGKESQPDLYPVVKLFTPDAGCTWLLTELDPEDHDIAFGLCDLGLGFPELGRVSLNEIASLTGRLGVHVERDRHFVPKMTISAYADEARFSGRIDA